MAGRVERRLRPAATPGYWRRHVHKESARNTGSPKAWSAMTNRKPVRDRLGALGGGEVLPLDTLYSVPWCPIENERNRCGTGLTPCLSPYKVPSCPNGDTLPRQG